mmetsp:Transcript_31260/g.69581  ORF Transcript_31260/g.69581 Transcript_31260/m.69581 type:complete len:676 (-) Transcript_31260:1228-3255(-)|eukprot:CAMPEP_0202895306 /NCGR_PEP_ID=MMETSP1392-20130828/4537_1 /ASSEMBLY_ACC=CAM_ASM_000868 /TAXON_ID=225041 /ORGANISM="Chlamydomonas chlamydogama, Strain SAG 11-48b" /LENGTH=675 /DNA_ID=CAMNT_0049580271 /DNA_START=98 /DNA_END=2125 /DNA_ORIENTATION=-
MPCSQTYQGIATLPRNDAGVEALQHRRPQAASTVLVNAHEAYEESGKSEPKGKCEDDAAVAVEQQQLAYEESEDKHELQSEQPQGLMALALVAERVLQHRNDSRQQRKRASDPGPEGYSPPWATPADGRPFKKQHCSFSAGSWPAASSFPAGQYCPADQPSSSRGRTGGACCTPAARATHVATPCQQGVSRQAHSPAPENNFTSVQYLTCRGTVTARHQQVHHQLHHQLHQPTQLHSATSAAACPSALPPTPSTPRAGQAQRAAPFQPSPLLDPTRAPQTPLLPPQTPLLQGHVVRRLSAPPCVGVSAAAGDVAQHSISTHHTDYKQHMQWSSTHARYQEELQYQQPQHRTCTLWLQLPQATAATAALHAAAAAGRVVAARTPVSCSTAAAAATAGGPVQPQVQQVHTRCTPVRTRLPGKEVRRAPHEACPPTPTCSSRPLLLARLPLASQARGTFTAAGVQHHTPGSDDSYDVAVTLPSCQLLRGISVESARPGLCVYESRPVAPTTACFSAPPSCMAGSRRQEPAGSSGLQVLDLSSGAPPLTLTGRLAKMLHGHNQSASCVHLPGTHNAVSSQVIWPAAAAGHMPSAGAAGVSPGSRDPQEGRTQATLKYAVGGPGLTRWAAVTVPGVPGVQHSCSGSHSAEAGRVLQQQQALELWAARVRRQQQAARQLRT